MRKSIEKWRSAIFALTMVAGTVFLTWSAPIAWAQQQSTNMTWQHPGKAIDSKATLQRPDDEQSVRDVADQVFDYPHAFGRMPSEIESEVKNRLVKAEIAFLQHSRAGVQESDVARFVNHVAERFHLPDYARTSDKQVRALRMSLMLESPVFMSQGALRPDMHVGESISSEMSVLQAAHVAQVLFSQKLINPDYQVTPDEWDQHSHEKEIQRIREAEAIQKDAASRNIHHSIGVRNNPKRDEMRQAFFAGTSSLGDADALALMDEASRVFKLNQ